MIYHKVAGLGRRLGQKQDLTFYGAGLWRDETGRQLEPAARHPGNCLSVKFEKLLAEPREKLLQISFLGDTFHASLLFYRRETPEMMIHDRTINATRPAQPAIAAKWRSELSPRQIGVIEAVAGDRQQELGYGLATRPALSAGWRGSSTACIGES